MAFTGSDGREHQPVMIHRALMGSMERFFGCLIEHYAGAFPLWLSPTQVAVFPLAGEVEAYAQEVAQKLEAAGLRVEFRGSEEHLNTRIKEAQRLKTPYMAIIGKREAESGSVALRARDGKQDVLPLQGLQDKLRAEVEAKA